MEKQKDLAAIAQLIRDWFPKATSVNLFVNSQEYTLEINERSSQSLKLDGISMRTLDGEWIQKD